MPTRHAALTSTVVLLAARAAAAQSPRPAAPRPPEYYSAAMLARAADSLRTQHTVARVLGDRGTYQYVLVVRDTTAGPEQHEKWTDVMLVQSGTATVLLGGRYEGSRADAPGELRGGRIVGATSRTVSAGDLLVIPAGVPHQVQVATGGVVRYVTIKAPESR